MNEQTIKIMDQEYQLVIKNNKPALRRYDEKSKMWVTVIFDHIHTTEEDKKIDKEIQNILLKSYIETM